MNTSSDYYDLWIYYKSVLGVGYFDEFEYNPWIGSIIGSILVGLSGIFPLLVIPIDGGANFHKGAGSQTLKLLLSFAVGGLLGDVFLHLLPEAWSYQFQKDIHRDVNDHPSMNCGMWVLTGLLIFTIVEKVFSNLKGEEETDVGAKEAVVNNNVPSVRSEKNSGERKTQVSGYLNLIANIIDNYTHGLAVGGSFLLSLRVGVLSTLAILIHEVPHEVGDFAILLRAGFTRLEAAKAQLATASSSLVGASTAIFFSGASDLVEARTSWILPFTAGGFLHISLVTVLPELLQEKNPKESFKQLFTLVLGVVVMYTMTYISE
ncbi:hypothetical protein AAG570_009536 [Ranatra chinensis]|uniref:Uncharacterized protein n=1 Tax=Ranatra chinensis TaxID=642074 RepID=A0ABD0YPD1_9HEMI